MRLFSHPPLNYILTKPIILKAVHYFRKNSILDVWQGSEYAEPDSQHQILAYIAPTSIVQM